MKVWVIKLNAPHNQEEGELFWNESEGWADLESADTFSLEEAENSTAPLPMDGIWVERAKNDDIIYILNEFFLAYKNSEENWWSYEDITKWWTEFKINQK